MELTLSLATLSVCAGICVAAPLPQNLTQGPPAVEVAGGASGTGVDPVIPVQPVHPPDAPFYAPLPLGRDDDSRKKGSE